jgi:hypothetical protein
MIRLSGCITNRSRKTTLSQRRLFARKIKHPFPGWVASWLVLSIVVSLPATAAASEAIGSSSKEIVVSGAGRPPVLVFACDGATSDVESVLNLPGVISDLRELNAGVALSLPDLSVERAGLVRHLNQTGIPVTAWLTLPQEQGYYLNAGNAPEAAARFADFEKWSDAYGLRWAAIGLDIEPNIEEFAALQHGGKWHLLLNLARRSYDGERIRRAKDAYSALIREMQARGYRVQTYQFPLIADERKVRSTLLERLSGILDVKGDEEVLMLYTSFDHKDDSALIWVYGPDAQAIAVGSTSGPDSDPRFARLHWPEFSRDIAVANHFSRTVGVYNLEGCVRQGFLSRLKTVNWSDPVTIPAESVRAVAHLRARIQTVLWIASHFLYFIAALFIAVAWMVARRIKRRRLRPGSVKSE